MNVGDKVKRNDRYKWCICDRKRRCICKDGEFMVKAVDKTKACQSGIYVKVARGSAVIDWCDSSYFVKAS